MALREEMKAFENTKPKKRQAKPGTRRITVELPEEEYNALRVAAEKQMREPNNLLSYMLRGGRLTGMLSFYDDEAEPIEQ